MYLLDMAVILRFACIALGVLLARARGPLCLDCDPESSPHVCNKVKECEPTESCFAEHLVYSTGLQAFTSGCRVTQECPDEITDVRKRFELSLCGECCTGDICNNNICRNGTAPPPGIPCLTCSNVESAAECSTLTYCAQGEVCFTEMISHSGHPTITMGCLKKEICNLFEAEIIGKREANHHACHDCCETPGCNKDACTHHQAVTAPPTTILPLPQPRDCWDLRSIYNINEDGIYQILSPAGLNQSVRCDMTTDGGGWTVFQKRINGDIDFNQRYSSYARGFGSLSSEFWMGNDLLHQFTAQENQTLRVEICDWDDTARYASYDSFAIGPPSDCFRLGVDGYHGDAGDALANRSQPSFSLNSKCFSTHDKDTSDGCASSYPSGWWFNSCYLANLNGIYQPTGPTTDDHPALAWETWKVPYSFKGAEMKFRPSSAVPTTHQSFTCPVG